MVAFIASGVLLASASGCATRPRSGGSPDLRATPSRSSVLQATVVGIYDDDVTLVDGIYQGPPVLEGAASRPTLRLSEPTIVFGDVDGVPGEEAVATLSANAGGSGEFAYVAVFRNDGDRARTIGVAELGDRVRVERLWLDNGFIRLDLVQPGPGEPACCGTERVRRTYRWTGAGLQLSGSDPRHR
jgi:hypothetical protein